MLRSDKIRHFYEPTNELKEKQQTVRWRSQFAIIVILYCSLTILSSLAGGLVRFYLIKTKT
jgi:hypothetical protein